jgi:hypothetical protein
MQSLTSKILGLTLATLFLSASAAAQASPIVRGKVRGYNPTTGNTGRVTGSYNANTGARSYRVRGYNPATQTYNGASGAYNPTTGRGYNGSSTYNPNTGLTTNVNTNQNGNYTCTANTQAGANCVKH